VFTVDNAERRAQRDAGELEQHLQRCQNQGLVHGTREQQENTARHLVTWGWTRIGPGEQVVQRVIPRDPVLSLPEELAATIAGTGINSQLQPVALAEHLVGDGWVKLAAGEKIVTPMSRAEAYETVRLALEHWEELKKTAKEKPAESAEVSADASELTSSVKGPDSEALILAAFAGADRPLEYTEACDAAAGAPVRFFPERPWHHWNAAFRSLEDRGLIEALPAGEGEVKRYQLTQAGRSPHKLDGVEVAPGTVSRHARILAAFGSCKGPMNPPQFTVIARAALVKDTVELKDAELETWTKAFAELVDEGMLEAEPAEPGTVRRWLITGAGVAALDTSIDVPNWNCWP
jgi:hypothetical protein